jgi:putative hydrolase
VSGILVFLTPEQRELFKKMQATMSLLEGHASWVMNELGKTTIHDLDRMRRTLKQRRQSGGMEKSFQRAIGFDQKVRQYDAGEAFVRGVVGRVGVEGLNRVWERPEHLPAIDEIGRPERWIARVAGV